MCAVSAFAGRIYVRHKSGHTPHRLGDLWAIGLKQRRTERTKNSVDQRNGDYTLFFIHQREAPVISVDPKDYGFLQESCAKYHPISSQNTRKTAMSFWRARDIISVICQSHRHQARSRWISSCTAIQCRPLPVYSLVLKLALSGEIHLFLKLECICDLTDRKLRILI